MSTGFVKNFKFRIYPKKSQQTQMKTQFEECRWVYNRFLEQRKTEWEENENSISMYTQIKTLPKLKVFRPTLKDVHSQVLQNLAVRIDLGFKAFSRRCQNGETPGYPRFRGRGRYDSMTYPQYGNGAKITDDGNLHLSKVGELKMVYHRPIKGDAKTVTVQKTSTDKWYATIACEFEPERLEPNDKAVGIDVGLNHFAVTSNGEKYDNPRFFRTEEKELKRAQRKLSKAEKGTKREKRRKVVARIHERIGFKRHNFIHQLSHLLVLLYGFIAVEDIHVNRMLHNRCLAKSISDAAWSQFFSALMYKAEYAGRQCVAVNPEHTSQTCSSCGHRQKMPLSKRIYLCKCCRLEIDRDVNAAINILALGRQGTSGN